MSKKTEAIEVVKSTLNNFFDGTMNTITAEKQRYRNAENKVINEIKDLLKNATAATFHLRNKVDDIKENIEVLSEQQQSLAQDLAIQEIEGDHKRAADLEEELTNVTAKKMAIQMKLDVLAKQETDISVDEKQKLLTLVNSFNNIVFDSTSIQNGLDMLDSLIQQLTSYKEKVSHEMYMNTQQPDLESILKRVNTDTQLVNAIVTYEARQYIREAKQRNLNNHSETRFVAMWLNDEQSGTFTEFCRKYHNIVSNLSNELIYYVNRDLRHNGDQYKKDNVLTAYELKWFKSEEVERLVKMGVLSLQE
ncbi:hypothetical protein ACQKMV_09450 [Lysinibacillus sp. NPDC094403]|uniref:hypothetical protein n=1 Tax=Lysinibacillus sp. NPDC094403 TaxID=3390581 RepID=UPI003D0267B1